MSDTQGKVIISLVVKNFERNQRQSSKHFFTRSSSVEQQLLGAQERNSALRRSKSTRPKPARFVSRYWPLACATLMLTRSQDPMARLFGPLSSVMKVAESSSRWEKAWLRWNQAITCFLSTFLSAESVNTVIIPTQTCVKKWGKHKHWHLKTVSTSCWCPFLFSRITQGRGVMPDNTTRFRCKGQQVYHYMGTSTFSEYTVCLEISIAKVCNKNQNILCLEQWVWTNSFYFHQKGQRCGSLGKSMFAWMRHKYRIWRCFKYHKSESISAAICLYIGWIEW